MCLTLCHPMDYSLTRLLCPWGFSRQEYWSGLPFPSPKPPDGTLKSCDTRRDTAYPNGKGGRHPGQGTVSCTPQIYFLALNSSRIPFFFFFPLRNNYFIYTKNGKVSMNIKETEKKKLRSKNEPIKTCKLKILYLN